MTTWTTLQTARDGAVLTVTLNRPDRLNALSETMQRELVALWAETADDDTVRAVVLTGRGRAFCAGADVADLTTMTDPANRPDGRGLPFIPTPHLAVPVVLALNGLCIGGGLRFLADADVVLASDTAFLSDPHVAFGQTAGPLAVELAARAGAGAVGRLLLCGPGYRMPVEEARTVGLVDEVHPAVDLTGRALALATLMADQPPAAVRATVRLLREARRPSPTSMDAAWAAMAALSARANPDHLTSDGDPS